MRSTYIAPSSVYPSRPGALHAVRFGSTIYTGAIFAKDASGALVGPGDVVAQAALVFQNLAAVLDAAGARLDQIARMNWYIDPAACRHLERVYEIRDRSLQRGAHAGTVVPLVVPEVGALIAVEAIAHVDGERSIVKQSATPANPFWPDAVRVADKLYVSGRYGTGKTFSEQARSIYDAFDAIVRASDVSWHDIVRVHQFGIRPDLSIDQIRAARAPYLRNEQFLSTSIVCHDSELVGTPPSWELIVDIEGAAGPKRYSSAPGTWANPGGLHVASVGDVGYFQAQMSRDSQGKTLFPDDAEAHTDQCCRNLNAMMDAAAIRWSDIVHARVFCKRLQDVPVARRVVDRWLNGSACARTELVANFFDPLATIEIELTANV